MSWLWFLRQYGFGACLADDMGLGKTVQLLSYLLKVKEVVGDELTVVPDTEMTKKRSKKDEDADPAGKVPTKAALIICPTSVLGNWQKELERFAPELKVHLHYGSNRLKEEDFAAKATDADIVLTSYGLTHLDFDGV